jgi:hypothetical protein
MADLSPASQAILDAIDSKDGESNVSVAIAVLRALAARIKGADAIRLDVISIADELEGITT